MSAEEPLAQLLSRQPMLALSMPSSLCTNWCETLDATHCTHHCLPPPPTPATTTTAAAHTHRWVGPFTITLMFELADKFGGARLAALKDFGSLLPAARELLQDVRRCTARTLHPTTRPTRCHLSHITCL